MAFASGDRCFLIALNRVPNVGMAKVRSLLRAYGSLAAAAAVSPEDIAADCKDIGPVLAQAIVSAFRNGMAEAELARARAGHFRLLTPDEPEWPQALQELESPPLCLYCLGDVSLLRQPAVAIIGTRRASVYGMEQARKFAQRLASADVQVLSGLAEGVDSAAHEGALLAPASAAGKTIAVIGAALDRVYPDSRKPLAQEIVARGGLLVSEYAFGRHADKQTFPQRNRIVAALSRQVLVAETAERGGTMITVGFARRLGRAIYAFPGRLDWPSFAGNHALIASGAARLALSPEQMLDALDGLFSKIAPNTPGESVLPAGLSEDEAQIYEAVGTEGVSLDELCRKTGLPMPQVMTLTIGLQMRRRLRPLPGGLVRRV